MTKSRNVFFANYKTYNIKSYHKIEKLEQHHFMKFETIAMQAISLLFSDSRSEQWPRELLIRICEHCIKILHRWKLKTNPRETEQLSRIPMSFNSSALLFTITILVKASQMHRGHFLHRYVDYWLNESNLLLKVIKHLVHVKFDDDGNQFLAYDESLAPGVHNNQHIQIINSLVYLYNRHYDGFTLAEPYDDRLPRAIVEPLKDLSENVYRRCSNHPSGSSEPNCRRRESDSDTFQYPCLHCNITIYCSKQCRQQHRVQHSSVCQFMTGATFVDIDQT
jgi:hypothetical protein